MANPLSADLDVVTKLYPNAVANMRSRMKSLGHKEYSYLPLWMRTVQSGEKAPLGFTLAVPICYCNPGLSALVKKRIADKNLKFKMAGHYVRPKCELLTLIKNLKKA